MSKYSRLDMIDFLNERMRPLKWGEWQMVTWEKVDKWCDMLGFSSRLTRRSPDSLKAGDLSLPESVKVESVLPAESG